MKTPTGNQPLPVELLIHVFGYVLGKQELARICLASKLFRSISLPLLYNKLHFKTKTLGEWEQQLLLFETLAIPRFADLVTSLEVSLFAGRVCVYNSAPCTCGLYDDHVGMALSTLKNLRILRFHCDLCRGNDRHLYLLNRLQTHQLQEFKFSCSCLISRADRQNTPVSSSILAASSMQTVTSLALACSNRWLIDATGTIQDEVLPLLSSLSYMVPSVPNEPGYSFEFPNELLSSKPVTRLYYPGPPLFADSIRTTGKRLEYLMTDDALSWLPTLVTRSLGMFANLKHIGTIDVQSCREENVLRALEPFCTLKALETIEFNELVKEGQNRRWRHEDQRERFVLIEPLVQDLGQQHRSLRRIHVAYRSYMGARTNDATLWEKRHDGIWSSRVVPLLGKWEVLNGELDYL